MNGGNKKTSPVEDEAVFFVFLSVCFDVITRVLWPRFRCYLLESNPHFVCGCRVVCFACFYFFCFYFLRV